jgi:hypothetical protein
LLLHLCLSFFPSLHTARVQEAISKLHPHLVNECPVLLFWGKMAHSVFLAIQFSLWMIPGVY